MKSRTMGWRGFVLIAMAAFILTPTPARAAVIAFRASFATEKVTSTTFTLSVPAGARVGDLMLAHVLTPQTTDGGNQQIIPLGWKPVITILHVTVAARILRPYDTSWTWTTVDGTESDWTGEILVYSGVSSVGEVAGLHVECSSSATAPSIVSPVFTVVLVSSHAYSNRSTNPNCPGDGQAIDLTPPLSFTERVQVTNLNPDKHGGMIESSDGGPANAALTTTTNQPTNVIPIVLGLG